MDSHFLRRAIELGEIFEGLRRWWLVKSKVKWSSVVLTDKKCNPVLQQYNRNCSDWVT